MTDYELFVELLTDKLTASLFSGLRLSKKGFRVESLTTQQKKNEIREHFRKKPEKFYNQVKLYNLIIPNIDEVDDTVYLAFLSSSELVPACVKWAHTVAKRNKLANEILPEIVERYQSGKQLFHYSYQFETDEEAMATYKQLNPTTSPSYVNEYHDRLQKRLIVKEKTNLDTMRRAFARLSPKDYFNNLNELREKYKDGPLMNLAYSMAHPDLDHQFHKDSILEFQENWIRNVKSQLVSIKQFDGDEAHELESEKKRADLLEKELRIRKRKDELQDKELKQLKQDSQSLQEDLKKRQNYEVELLEKLETAQQQVAVAQSQQEAMDQRLISWAGEDLPMQQFTILFTHSGDLLHSLYPEVSSYPVKEWRTHLPQTHNRVYIQRDGLTTREITALRQEFAQKQKNISFFHATTPKEMLEAIEQIKLKEGVSRERI